MFCLPLTQVGNYAVVKLDFIQKCVWVKFMSKIGYFLKNDQLDKWLLIYFLTSIVNKGDNLNLFKQL